MQNYFFNSLLHYLFGPIRRHLPQPRRLDLARRPVKLKSGIHLLRAGQATTRGDGFRIEISGHAPMVTQAIPLPQAGRKSGLTAQAKLSAH